MVLVDVEVGVIVVIVCSCGVISTKLENADIRNGDGIDVESLVALGPGILKKTSSVNSNPARPRFHTHTISITSTTHKATVQ